jgi:uncharacterized protein (DUF3084 family)
MSADFEKYMKTIKKIEGGIEQLMKDAAKKSEEALAMKKDVAVLVEDSKKELESYKAARKVTQGIIETRTKELIDVNAQISEMESKITLDTQKRLDELNAKIEEAKVETSEMIQMNKMITSLREMLESQSLIKGQVY